MLTALGKSHASIPLEKKATDADIDCFEKHMRMHIFTLAELYPNRLSWYHAQAFDFMIKQFRAVGSLMLNSQQCVEHSMQTVARAVKHSTNGANVGTSTELNFYRGLKVRSKSHF